ncbi:MAG: Glu/Leu/Phe/Val dehydrogenase [Archangium sp.]|nr:Glu/Leu/Phe/Val dehydrogenase [Archangium sp.]
MTPPPRTPPYLTVHFRDPVEGTSGYLVIDRLIDGLAAGGLRIRPGVDAQELGELARNMTLKQAAAGIRVGGAKSGLDMDPASPARPAVLKRFLEALRPMLSTCFNCGPDLNTTMRELEGVAQSVGLPSLKIAVGRSRGLSDAVFLERYALFEARIDGWSVNELRAATAVAAAVTSTLRQLGLPRGRVAIQGAGNMGGATAYLLAKAGIPVVAWADDEKCLLNPAGLDVTTLVRGRQAGRLPASPGAAPSKAVLTAEADVLVLAAISRAFGADVVPTLKARAIVEAANLALTHEVEELFHQRGVAVIPDLLASVGGSIAVEALYVGAPKDGETILRHVDQRASALVTQLLEASKAQKLSPRRIVDAQAAAALNS